MDTYRQKLDAGEQVADVLDEPLENAHASAWSVYTGEGLPDEPDTSISVKKARQLANQLIDIPEDFILHPRVQKIIESRGKMASGKALMDWGFAETLAYASLADQGKNLRLVGQDSGRGTFFHRHAVLHNQVDGSSLMTLKQINPDARVTIIDSLLSEEAVMGFEYGFATAAPSIVDRGAWRTRKSFRSMSQRPKLRIALTQDGFASNVVGKLSIVIIVLLVKFMCNLQAVVRDRFGPR